MNATQLGLNPYAHPNTHAGNKAMEMMADTKVDARATGLDGDILDQVMKGRWQEGFETGYEDGMLRAQQSYGPIFDDGFQRGANYGARAEGAQIHSVLLPMIERLGALLAEVRGMTGSGKIRAAIDAELPVVRGLLNREIGRYQDQAQAAGEPPTP